VAVDTEEEAMKTVEMKDLKPTLQTFRFSHPKTINRGNSKSTR
jgi:hypothetical protein